MPPDADEVALWNLMNDHNWDDGYTVPLAVARHPRCDRALALRLFWELDDTARLHLSDEETALSENFSDVAKYEPEEFTRIVAYATTLVDRLRRSDYPEGQNQFDTGFMAVDLPNQGERQRKLRELRTKRAQQEYDEVFLFPSLHPG